MTQRRDIKRHRHSLDEIREIMNSMKNLSFMETRKISSFLDVQHSITKHIEMVAADFLGFYPDTLTETTGASAADIEAYLLLGTERGFCGDFNHTLLRHFETLSVTADKDKLRIICVGHKLATLLQNDARRIIFIDGASVAEEVGHVLNQIVNQLSSLQQHYGSLKLYVLYHNDQHQLINQQLLPSFQDLLYQPVESHAPEINIKPRKFLLDLSYHYLFVILYEILYTSLMAESRQRVSHLEGAIQHMDEQSEELHRQDNILRQEEIIEEIEVMLLGSISLDQ